MIFTVASTDDIKSNQNYASDDIKKLLGKNVRAYRIYKNLSQEKLAELARLSPLTISKIETGQEWPSSLTLASLCAAMDVRPSRLFIDDEDDLMPKGYAVETLSDAFKEIINQFKHSPSVMYNIKH